MNGYEIMAASYRQMVKQGRIDKETADKEIRIYDFLATCDTEDICRMGDSSAFNDIIKRLSKRLLKMQILTRMQGKKWLPSSVICSMKRRQDRFSMAD